MRFLQQLNLLIAAFALALFASPGVAAPFSESFEATPDLSGASSFQITHSGVVFTIAASQTGQFSLNGQSPRVVQAQNFPTQGSITISRQDNQPWTFTSIYVDNTLNGSSVSLVANLNVGGTTVYPIGNVSGTFGPLGSGVPVTSVQLTGTNIDLNFDLLVGDTTYVPPPPTITAVTPNLADNNDGTSIVITGTNFSSVTRVYFSDGNWNQNVASYTVDSTTQISAITSTGMATGTGHIYVETPDGVASIPFQVLPTLDVTQLSVAQGPSSGGTQVTIQGYGFMSGGTSVVTAVEFGGVAAQSFQVNSATQISAVTPSHAVGAADVVVSTAAYSETLSNSFTFMAPMPTITGASPSAGPLAGGTTVIITGSNFVNVTDVDFGLSGGFGTTPARSYVVNSSTQITAVTDSMGGSGHLASIQVRTASGLASSANAFQFVAAPQIYNISQASGEVGGGTSVQINGNYFTPSSTVTIGGTAASSVTYNSSSSLTVITPAHSAGTVDLVVTTAGGSATANSAFTYVAPSPTMTGVSPSSGSGGTTITITGTNFNSISGTPVVEISNGCYGGLLATNVVKVSDTEITATVRAMTNTNCYGLGSRVQILSTVAYLEPAWTYVAPLTSQTITFANPGAQNFGTTQTLSASTDSSLVVSFTSSTTGVCTITSGGALTFITAGTCTINADQAGDSSYSAAPTVSRSFSVNAVAPGAPTIGTATAGDTQATITFTAPASTGGSAITGYTVTSSPGGMTGTSNGSPITVTGLTNGVAYTFTVTATNSAGTGPSSAASNSVTPQASQQQATAPAAPTNLTATAGDGSATISFTAGSDGGSPITNYKYSRDGGSSWWALSPSDTTSPITIPGLTNGTAYSISVLAVNSVGDGQPSQSVSVTPQAQSLNNIISSDPLFWFSSPDSTLPSASLLNLSSNLDANLRLILWILDRYLSDNNAKNKDENFHGIKGPMGPNGDDINIVSLYGDQFFASTKGTNGLQITGFDLNADDNGGFLFSSMNYLSVANGWRRAGFAELNYRDTEGVGSTLSMNGRMSWERYANASTMYGYFLGADVQRSNLQSGAPGRQNTWGGVAGAYVIAQAENGVIGSAYGGIGLNANDLFMDDGTVTVADQYGTQSIMLGASVSGEMDRQSYLLRPSVSANFGQTFIGDLSMTQTTGGNSTALPVSGGTVRFYSLVVEPEFVFKMNASAVGQGLSEVTLAPRLTCERREAVTGTRDCGSGLALNLTRASGDGLTTVNAGVSFDRIGGQDRSSAKLQLQMAF